MRRIRIDVDFDLEARSVIKLFLEALEDAACVPGDAFDRYVDRQSFMAAQMDATARAKEALVGSAKSLRARLGPGFEITCSLAGVPGRLLIARNYVDGSFQRPLSAEGEERLRQLFRSVGEGEINEW
jgi:hypothetical protein